MKTIVVRYRLKPECVAEHEGLLAAVFVELETNAVAGVEYRALKLDDGVTFVHVADVEGAIVAGPNARPPCGTVDDVSELLPELHRARESFLDLVGPIRPELHRYCARLTGSVVEGEDIVQETLAKAFYAVSQAAEVPPLRPEWTLP